MEEKSEELLIMNAYLYEFFYQEVVDKNYYFNPNENQKKQISNFLKKLDKTYNIYSIGINFLIDYYAFQFSYWSNLTTRFKGKIMLNWIVGDKAFKRWMVKNKEYKYFGDRFLSNYKINKEILKNTFSQPDKNLYLQYRKIEELEKSRFYNTPRGLLNCIEKTKYSNRSSYCLTCNFKNDCKKIK